MVQFFTVVFYQPLLNLLIFFYNVIPGHDIGLAIIAITVVLKLVLYPFSIKMMKSQKAMHQLQPKVDALKAQYKDNKEKLASELMELYKREKISPFSSCLPLLIQLPFLIAVYQVFRTGLSNGDLILYPFIAHPGMINPVAFGFLDLSNPNWVLAVMAAVGQYLQAKTLVSKKPEIKSEGSKDEDLSAMMNKQMTIMMPVLTLIIGLSLPSGLVLYWFLVTVITALQQYITFKFFNQDKKDDGMEIIDPPASISTPPSDSNSQLSV